MRIEKKVHSTSNRAGLHGFTLVVTLAILAAVTILVVGLFGILTRESQTASAYDGVEQADLAMQAGLEAAGALLKQALADELGVIFAAPLTPALDAHNRPRELLVAARYDTEKESWQYQPLVSGVAQPPPSDRLRLPASGFEKQPGPQVPANKVASYFLDPLEPPTIEQDARRLPRPSPWLAAKPKFWLEVKWPAGENAGDGGLLVGRYAFEVEDVQSRLSLASAGHHDFDPDHDHPLRHWEELTDVTQTQPHHPPMVPGLIIDPGGRWRRMPAQLWTLLEPGREWLPNNLDPGLWPFASGSAVSSQHMHRLLGSPGAKRVLVSADGWREMLLKENTLLSWPYKNEETREVWPGKTGLVLPWQGLGQDARLLSERFTTSEMDNATDPQAIEAVPGSLKHPQLRRLEENTTGAWAAYDELALIPHDAGIKHGGLPKLNLNQLLVEAQAHTPVTDPVKARAVVEKIADHLDLHLPEFRKRAGGYPLPRATPLSERDAHEKAYLKCLAAGIIDYADIDPLPTMNIENGGGGKENGADSESRVEYRGMDAFPLVSEYWQRHRYQRLISQSRVEYSLTDYAELWNLTNQEIAGEVLISFEYRGRLWVGSEVYPVMTTVLGNRVIKGRPREVPGLDGLWLVPEPQEYYSPDNRLDAPDPEQTQSPPGNPDGCWITLRPNQIAVLRCPPVVFHLDTSGIETITGVQYFGQPAYGNDERESRYRLAFRPKGAARFTVVDLPFQTLERYQRTATASNRQSFNVTQCGLSYRLRDQRWAFNVGDLRAAYFIDYHQEVIDYVNGCSPWGRNFRGFERMAGGVRTYLWPDGGHNSEPCPGSISQANHGSTGGNDVANFMLNPTVPANDTNNFETRPYAGRPDPQTHPAVHAGNSAAERLKYIQHLSSRGRLFSPTELGHVFDPVMWNPNGKEWADVEVLYGQHADISPEVFARSPSTAELDAHKRFCGGNTLRIGRNEHSAFRPDYRPAQQRDPARPDHRGMAASTLLDLFHCGDPNALDVEAAAASNLARIDGHVNVNTATRGALRALVAGRLRMDPLMVTDSGEYPAYNSNVNSKARYEMRFSGRGNQHASVPADGPKNAGNKNHRELEPPKVVLPPTSDPELAHADLVAEAIIRNRPYVSPAEVAEKAVITPEMQPLLDQYRGLSAGSPAHREVMTPVAMGMPVFGYTERAKIKPDLAPTAVDYGKTQEDRRVKPQWADRAAEEVFARLWNNSTTRSRHFQITVTGQAVRKSRGGNEKVLATRTRVYQVFVRPVRAQDGTLLRQEIEITHSQPL